MKIKQFFAVLCVERLKYRVNLCNVHVFEGVFYTSKTILIFKKDLVFILFRACENNLCNNKKNIKIFQIVGAVFH